MADLLGDGLAHAHGPFADQTLLRLMIDRLPPFGQADPFTIYTVSILDSLTNRVFEGGWQPTEALHAVRRAVGARPSRVLLELIASHAARTSAHTIAPDEWREQLRELGIDPSTTGTASRLSTWRAADGLSDTDTWHAILSAASVVYSFVDIAPLVPVPSQWGTTTHAARATRSESRALTRIRGLLAKAERTPFPSEAEAFSAKAQELMSRYAIDAAVLDADEHPSSAKNVGTRRLLIDNPYPEAKVQLLHGVCSVNGARVVWDKQFGLASIVGMPVDLDLCELLFTSLLVQSGHALRRHGRSRTTRSASYRRSFLVAYAVRIEERLAEVHLRARTTASEQYGRDLVPILAERSEAVGSVFDALFPETQPMMTGSSDGIGWYAGRSAAEDADLTGGRDSLPDE